MIDYELIKKIIGEKILTAREIVELGELDITPRKLASDLGYYRDIQVIRTGSPLRYALKPQIVFTGKVEKDKNILKMELTTGDFIEYDFKTNKYLSNLAPHDRAEGIENNIVLQIFCNNRYDNLQRIEWLFSYIDLIDNRLSNLSDFTYKTCPSGYINWLRDKNLKINTDTMELYSYCQKYPSLPTLLLQRAIDDYNYYYHRPSLEDRIKICNELFTIHNLDKIIRNSYKKYELDMDTRFNEIICIINDFEKNNLNWNLLIDNNRTLRDNIKVLKTALEEKENQLMSGNLQKLNFLNNLVFNDYIIVVPQNIEDLIIEGKNQNNCVGHYYNKNILRGEDLIYFLRDKNNIDHSIVTCRYNIQDKATVEHRQVNNNWTSKEQNDLIKEIDKIINENLKAL